MTKAHVATYVIARKRGVPILPPRTPAADDDPSFLASSFVRELDRAAGTCDAAKKLARSIDVGREQQAHIEAIASAMPGAVAECACQLDVPGWYKTWTRLLFDGVPVVTKRVVGVKAARPRLIKEFGIAFYDAIGVAKTGRVDAR